MANMQKYNAGNAQRICNHCTRASNVNIDLAGRENPKEYIKNRIAEVHHINRADTVQIVDWVVSVPDNVPQDKEEDFFKSVYGYFNSRYGNIAWATIHMDEHGEKTDKSKKPHIHIGIVPIVSVQDKPYNEKLCAKELFNRAELRGFHERLSEYVEGQLGFKADILNHATEHGNKSIEELKRGTAIEEVRALNEIGKALQSQNEELATEIVRQKARRIEQERGEISR